MDELKQAIAELQKKAALQEQMLSDISTRVENILYMQLMDRMAPQALSALLPKLSDDFFDYDSSWSGLGRAYSAKRLRQAAAKLLMSMAVTQTFRPFPMARQLMEEAIRTNRNDVSIYGVNLSFVRYQGNYPVEKMVQECERFEYFNDWSPGHEHAWAICIESHYLSGNDTHAEKLVEAYMKNYNLRLLEDVPVAARYAHRLGMSNQRVALTADFVEETEKNSHLLASILDGKSVVIVGGGPYEKGKGQGEDIDSHDVVIRVKHIPYTPEQIADYGSRTDILSINSTRQGVSSPVDPDTIINVPWQEGIGNYLLAYDLSRRFIDYNIIARLMTLKSEYGINIMAPNHVFLGTQLGRWDSYTFSAGFYTILLIKAMRPELPTSSLYGFYHTHSDFAGGHYFNPVFTVANPIDVHHNFQVEKECFDALFRYTAVAENSGIVESAK